MTKEISNIISSKKVFSTHVNHASNQRKCQKCYFVWPATVFPIVFTTSYMRSGIDTFNVSQVFITASSLAQVLMIAEISWCFVGMVWVGICHWTIAQRRLNRTVDRTDSLLLCNDSKGLHWVWALEWRWGKGRYLAWM